MGAASARLGSTPPGQSDGPAQRTLELAALALLQLLLLHGFRNALDLHAWDEAIYYRQGVDLWKGQIDGHFFAWGPGLSVAYAILSALPLAGWHPCDAMLLCVTTGSTLALWWAFRAILPAAAAVGIAAWWGAGLPDLVQGGPMAQTSIYIFVATLQFIALGCVARGRVGLALIALAYGGLTRPEMGFFMVLFCAGAAWLAHRGRDRGLRTRAVAGLAVGLAITAMHLTLPDARDRSWLVFRQHYAMGVAERRAESPDAVEIALAHADPDPYVTESFGAAKSILQAAVANPTALAEHMLVNLGEVSKPLGQLCIAPFSHVPWERNALLACLLVLIALGMKRGREVRTFFRTPRPQTVWLFLIAGLLAIPISMLVRPRRELLLAVMPLIFAIAGRAAAAGTTPLLARLGNRTSSIAAPAIVVLLALATPRRFEPLATAIHDQRTSMEMLNRSDIPPGSKLLAYNAVNLLKYTDLEGVRPLNLLRLCFYSHSPHANVRAVIEAEQPDFFLVTPTATLLEPLGREVLAEIRRDEWALEDLSPISMLLRRKR